MSVRTALVVVWVVVNLVNLLQTVGFVTRVSTWEIQRIVGTVIAGLAVPASLALLSLIRSRAGWRLYLGPLLFDAFVVLLVVVEYALAIEWRTSERLGLLVPMLGLFFGSIFFMGAPMFRIDRRLWAVTATTTSLLLISMTYAIVQGVG